MGVLQVASRRQLTRTVIPAPPVQRHEIVVRTERSQHRVETSTPDQLKALVDELIRQKGAAQ